MLLLFDIPAADVPSAGSNRSYIMQSETPMPRKGRVSYALIAGLLGAPTIIVIIALLVGGVFHW